MLTQNKIKPGPVSEDEKMITLDHFYESQLVSKHSEVAKFEKKLEEVPLLLFFFKYSVISMSQQLVQCV